MNGRQLSGPDSWLNRPAGRRICSLALCLLLYAAVWAFQDAVTFYSADDTNIAWALAGYRSGAPSFAHPFLNPVPAFAVSGLYTLLPGIPWWLVFQTLCVLGSAFLTASAVLRTGAEKRLPPWLPLTALAVLYAAGFYYSLTLVSFTMTAALIGTASCARVLAENPEEVSGKNLALSACLLGASVMIRVETGWCCLCFFLGSLLVLAVSARVRAPQKWKAARRRIAGGALIALALTALMTALYYWSRTAQNPEGFAEFDDARCNYMDYPHDSYSQNPELYESIGWDENLYSLVNAWFYMDERVSTEALETAFRQSAYRSQPIPEHAAAAWRNAAAFFGKYPVACYLAAVSLLALAILLLQPGWKGPALIRKLAALAFPAGSLILLLALGWAGRINLRAWMTIAVPCMACEGILILGGAALQSGKLFRKAACFALAAGMIFCAYRVFRTVTTYRSEEHLKRSDAVADYVLRHPENLYIRDVYTAINWNAARVYPDEKPTNLMDWGDCDTGNRARLAQWRTNGFSGQQQADVFLREGVYYLCTEGDPYLELLEAYLRSAWGAGGYEIADRIEGDILVIRFVK